MLILRLYFCFGGYVCSIYGDWYVRSALFCMHVESVLGDPIVSDICVKKSGSVRNRTTPDGTGIRFVSPLMDLGK